MAHLTAFICLVILSCGYAFWQGERDSRLMPGICVSATLASAMLLRPLVQRYSGVETSILVIDIATFAGFIVVAMSSFRFWPLWMAGLQLTTLLAHLMVAIDAALVPRAYATAAVFWSYPILLILAFGTWRASQRRRHDHEPG